MNVEKLVKLLDILNNYQYRIVLLFTNQSIYFIDLDGFTLVKLSKLTKLIELSLISINCNIIKKFFLFHECYLDLGLILSKLI